MHPASHMLEPSSRGPHAAGVVPFRNQAHQAGRCFQGPSEERGNGQALRPGAHQAPGGRGQLRGGRPLRQRPGEGPAGRWRDHGHGGGGGPSRGADGQRQHHQGRQLGCPHRGEDHPHPGRGDAHEGAHALSGGQRRGPHHGPARHVPRPPPRGTIFHMEVALSGLVPQICLLFGPSAAGGAYIPAFCDVVVMVEGNASMYLGSPRMAEMVIGEKISLEDLGGAKHALFRERLRRLPLQDGTRGHRTLQALLVLLPPALRRRAAHGRRRRRYRPRRRPWAPSCHRTSWPPSR